MGLSANNITLDSLTLPYELRWVDEFAWTSIVSNSERTLQGVNIVESSQFAGQSGRSIILESDQAWITKTNLETLHTWSKILGKEMTLTLQGGTAYTVRFNHDDSEPITAEQVKQIAELADDDEYILTLKFLVV